MGGSTRNLLFSGIASLGMLFTAAAHGQQEQDPAQSQPSTTAAPQAGTLQAAQERLARFNADTHGARAAKTNPAIAVESAQKQIDVLEAVTFEHMRDGSFTPGAYDVMLLDIHEKIRHAAAPEGGAAPAPAGIRQELSARYEKAAEDGHMTKARAHFHSVDLFDPRVGELGIDTVQAILAAAQDVRREVAAMKNAENREEGRKLVERLPSAIAGARMKAGQQAHAYLVDESLGYGSGETLATLCRVKSKDTLADRVEELEGTVLQNLHYMGGDAGLMFGENALSPKEARAAFDARIDGMLKAIRNLPDCAPDTPARKPPSGPSS